MSYLRDRIAMTTGRPTATASLARFTTILPIVVTCFICTQCSIFSGGEMVTKPRTHKSWYKKSIHKNSMGIGRYRFKIPNFERSGVKKVRMK